MSGIGTYETLRVARDARGIATLTLARPEKHNAMSPQMIAELALASRALGADDATRVVILAAEGVSFSAGADLGWMRAQFEASREARMTEARALADMLMDLDTLPKPLIARVQGQAFGGGLGLMAVCDAVIAAEGARFGFSETRLGIIPATISPYVFAKTGGAVRRVFASPRLFDAAEAKEYGLVSKVVEAHALDAAVEAEAAPYLNGAPGAIAAAKRLANEVGPSVDHAMIERTIAALADAWETAEAQEGVAAFLNKTKPSWVAER